MAVELAESGADVRVPRRDQACGLHDEHDRVAEHDLAGGDEEPGAVPFAEFLASQVDAS